MTVQMTDLGSLCGVLEMIFGLTTTILYSNIAPIDTEFAMNLFGSLGCTSGLVPLMMRWSNKFWEVGNLSNPTEAIICIWSAACYITGGVIVLIVYLDRNYKDTLPVIVIVFSLLVGVIVLLDFLLFSKK